MFFLNSFVPGVHLDLGKSNFCSLLLIGFAIDVTVPKGRFQSLFADTGEEG